MLHVGTTLHPGENINFSLDDKGEMYINAKCGGTGGDELPWCSGYFEDRSIGAGEWVRPTAIVSEGFAGLLVGNRFVAPEDGWYLFHAGGGNGSAAPSQVAYSAVVFNSDSYVNSAVLGQGISSSGTPAIPFVECSWPLRKGEYISHFVRWYNTAQATINGNDTIHKFSFICVRKGL